MPRVVLVSRRFWPLVGGAERVMALIASGLKAAGCPVTVLTARADPSWPEMITLGQVPVLRLPQPQRRGWGTWRYMAAVGDWLRRHRHQYDLVYVSMLKHDAYAALGASRVPVALRAEGGGKGGDVQWQRTARMGWMIRHRCQRAAALVAPSMPIARELAHAGYPADHIHELPNGVPVAPEPTSERKAAARRALAEVHPSLFLSVQTPLVVYLGRLHAAKGVHDLVSAWRIVISNRPNTRLWLIGEGPAREALERQISHLGLHAQVTLVGSFSATDDLLAAADLLVLPSYEEGMSMALLEAMAAALPIVATDIPANRAILEDGKEAWLVPPRDPHRLAAAVEEILASPEAGAKVGRAAVRRQQSEFTAERMIQRHLELFDRLLADRASPASRQANPPTETI